MTERVDTKIPTPKTDPGAFSAALFQAYKGDCNCEVCQILRDAVQQTINPYIKNPGGKKPGRG